MSFLKELVESCIPLWEQSLEKPFLREMALGTLAPELSDSTPSMTASTCGNMPG